MDANISSSFRKAHKAFKELGSFSVILVLFSQLVSTTLFPFVEAHIRQLNNVDPSLLNLVYALHVVFAGYAVLGVVKIKDFILAVGVDDIEQNLKKANEDLGFEKEKNAQLTTMLGQLGAVQGGLSVLHEILSRHENGAATQEEVAGLLAPLVQLRSEVMGFTNSEMYNFAVYIADKKRQQLHLFYRACDDRIEKHNRSWPIGVGHVGVAFARKAPIISVDASKEADITGEFPHETDKVYYASFICAPINGSTGQANEPVGVFVITSSRPGHLNQAYQMVAESFALVLSSYFAQKKLPQVSLAKTGPLSSSTAAEARAA